jgi:Lrp/AsnC family leucine-responsive transcriptional regulator
VSNLSFTKKKQNDFRFNRQKLLSLLQTDSKRQTKELSLKLNLSVTAVYERIKKLEREGIIDMLCYLIKQSRKGFVVFCHLKTPTKLKVK